MLRGVEGIEHLHHFIVHTQQFGKFPGCQRIGELVAIHSLNTGQAHGALHFRAGIQLFQHPGFRFIVTAGHHQCHHVTGTKGILDLEIGVLVLTHFRGFQIRKAIGIGTLTGKPKCAAQHQYKQNRYHPAGLDRKFSHKGDIGQKFLMPGLIDQGTKQHQKSRH